MKINNSFYMHKLTHVGVEVGAGTRHDEQVTNVKARCSGFVVGGASIRRWSGGLTSGRRPRGAQHGGDGRTVERGTMACRAGTARWNGKCEARARWIPVASWAMVPSTRRGTPVTSPKNGRGEAGARWRRAGAMRGGAAGAAA